MQLAQDWKRFDYQVGGRSIAVFHRDAAHASEDNGVDPSFFDEGYTIAASTGLTRVWDGTHALCAWLQHAAAEEVRGKRVIELGSGTGLAGIFASMLGAHVLLTDVAALLPLLRHNIAANSVEPGVEEQGARSGLQSMGSVGGSAAACMLDWTEDALTQLHEDTGQEKTIHLIIACEVLWLEELVVPFLNTLRVLMDVASRPKTVLAEFERRTSDGELVECWHVTLLSYATSHHALSSRPQYLHSSMQSTFPTIKNPGSNFETAAA